MHSRNAARLAVATASLAALLAGGLAFAAPADDVTRPLKAVVGNVRQGRDLKALDQFHFEAQGRLLLGEEWGKATEAQRKEFKELFARIFGKIAFPKIRDNLKHFSAMTFTAPVIEGNTAKVDSVIVILHPMKKQELKLKYAVAKDKSAWRVVDVAVLGDSMLTGIREDQIIPIMKEGGWDNLLGLMRKKDAELKGVVLK